MPTLSRMSTLSNFDMYKFSLAMNEKVIAYDMFSEYKYLIVNLVFFTSVFGERISF